VLEDLQQQLAAGRPVPAENLHLTLAFLGDVEPDALEDLDRALAAITVPPVPMRLSGLTLSGPAAHGRLELEAAADPALRDLQKAVRRAARQAGLTLRSRPFHPHVTLVRFGRDMPQRALDRLSHFIVAHRRFALPPFEAESFALYRSDLRPEGARYTALAEYPLTAGQGGA
jgi:2'-5' RNA ligase